MSLSARSVLFSVDPFRRYHCLCDVLLYCFGIFVDLGTICPWLGRFDILLSVAERSLSMAGSF